MKLACSRCWDRDCNCTKEQLLEYELKEELRLLNDKSVKVLEKLEDLALGGYKTIEEITSKGCDTFYLDGFVIDTGKRLCTYPIGTGDKELNLYCVAYPNKFKIITNSCLPVTIKKGTRFYNLKCIV